MYNSLLASLTAGPGRTGLERESVPGAGTAGRPGVAVLGCQGGWGQNHRRRRYSILW